MGKAINNFHDPWLSKPRLNPCLSSEINLPDLSFAVWENDLKTTFHFKKLYLPPVAFYSTPRSLIRHKRVLLTTCITICASYEIKLTN